MQNRRHQNSRTMEAAKIVFRSRKGRFTKRKFVTIRNFKTGEVTMNKVAFPKKLDTTDENDGVNGDKDEQSQTESKNSTNDRSRSRDTEGDETRDLTSRIELLDKIYEPKQGI